MLNLKQPTLSSEATVEETNDGDLDDWIPKLMTKQIRSKKSWRTNRLVKISQVSVVANLFGKINENYENKEDWIPNLVFIRGKHGNDKRGKEEFPEPAGAEETT